MTAARPIDGHGLHSGGLGSVRFSARRGPVVLRSIDHDVERPMDQLRVAAADRSTRASLDEGVAIATVEHLFAALAGASIREGVLIEVVGPEIPLADGGALAFLEALAPLGIAPRPPRLHVSRGGEIVVGASRYAFRQDDGVDVEVVVDFDDRRLAPTARWQGDAADFRARIATARTFGFAHEVEALLARGLARHVAPESVVVIDHARVLSAGRPFLPDEPARHKLLDLVGDLYPYGGPPRGAIRATRPGHAATHEAMVRALADGLLVRV